MKYMYCSQVLPAFHRGHNFRGGGVSFLISLTICVMHEINQLGRCDLIALIEDVSPLRVSQDHPLHTNITDHLRTEHDGRYI